MIGTCPLRRITSQNASDSNGNAISLCADLCAIVRTAIILAALMPMADRIRLMYSTRGIASKPFGSCSAVTSTMSPV